MYGIYRKIYLVKTVFSVVLLPLQWLDLTSHTIKSRAVGLPSFQSTAVLLPRNLPSANRILYNRARLGRQIASSNGIIFINELRRPSRESRIGLGGTTSAMSLPYTAGRVKQLRPAAECSSSVNRSSGLNLSNQDYLEAHK